MDDQEFKNMFIEFKNDLMTGINGICTRLDQMESRLARVEERLVRVEKRLVLIEERLDRVEERLDRIEIRLDTLETRVDKLEKGFEKFKVETRKNFKRVNERFDQVDLNFERVDRKLDELRMNMDQRFNLVSDQLDILNGRKPNPSLSSPSEHARAELRETSAPYMVHDIDMSQAVLSNKDIPEKKTYLLSLFTASESQLIVIRNNLITRLLDVRRSLKRTNVSSPELLVKRESLISSLSSIIDRLFSFAYIPQGMDALQKFVEKNGEEALLKTWNDSQEAYKELENQALSLLKEAVDLDTALN